MNIRTEWLQIRRREPVILAVLFLLAIASFIAVSALTNSYRARQRHVTWQLYARASAAMKAGDYQGATRAFRAALDLAPDNTSYQLWLAEALMKSGREAEALPYLEVLWDREPENGEVNLQLARNYASRGDTEQAIRHYQNAIYSVWKIDPDANRRTARLELIRFLLAHGSTNQADAELVALAGNLPEDAGMRNQVAALFSETRDYTRSLSQYERVLRSEPQNAEATAGAGEAAFHLGQYRTAQRYLSEAVHLNPGDSESAKALVTAGLVRSMDPFDRHISETERRARVLDAFRVASVRLQDCANSSNALDRFQELRQRQSAIQATFTNRRLKTDSASSIMDLVFEIEQATQPVCGEPTGKDLGLLLLSKDRGDAER